MSYPTQKEFLNGNEFGAGLPVSSGTGFEDFLFAAFTFIGIVIVICQFIPGIMLCTSLLKNLFSFSRVEIKPARLKHGESH
ncbi:hypothetical protein GURASL_09230 [Geotalea uraniireducens]|uniref:Uncharacterized protein n=1 Tax=Geotalea uraniireducens TaxID=351604 RepID=A0ABM8EIE3_9BACT|nr:hypothetical protein [Geotalea uraniireducens]BDV42000.1 hypothetical protein GURASL_09230 [Geotalea uraniireducens]